MQLSKPDHVKTRPSVLFLCTGNSCRSQMAEGWLRHLAGERFEVFSAGLEPRDIHPLAVAVMRDAGIDISGQRSKSVSEFLGRKSITYAVFVCAAAEKNCPTIYPFSVRRLSWPFEDPAEFRGSGEERYAKFIEVRDQIATKIQKWLSDLEAIDASEIERGEL